MGSPPTGFDYVVDAGGDVRVRRGGRVVTVLRGSAAERFLRDVARGDARHAQQVMARVTGNYKRGNERVAGDHPRNRPR